MRVIPPTLLVCGGAEERAVRRTAAGARVIALRAGAAAASALPSDLARPIVLLGLCGALRELPLGTIVVYGAACDADGSVTAESAALADAHRVRGYTAPRIVTRGVERAELARRYDADVVDMEGTHVARALAARGLRCAMVRVVSDGPQADLPPIEDAIDGSGTLQPLVLAAGFARDPAAAARFIGGVRRALRVLGEVARELSAVRA